MNYEELLEKTRETYESEDTPHVVKAWLLANIIYPTDESEDERTRKELIEQIAFITPNNDELDDECNVLPTYQKRIDKYRAWLEKQGKQKPTKNIVETWKDMRLEVYQQASGNRHEPNYSDDTTKMFSLNDIDEIIEKMSEQTPADKVEPRFHEGDWIISNNKKSIYQVIEVKRGIYVIRDNVDNHEYHIGIEECEKSGRLWSINDAKEGDVLMTTKTRNCPFIYRKTDDNKNLAYHYAGVDGNGNFCEGCLKMTMYHFGPVADITPATKEQRDLLFKKMKEEGYEWYSEKKELKKIVVKTIDADKVIEWMKTHGNLWPRVTIKINKVIDKFKKDFDL